MGGSAYDGWVGGSAYDGWIDGWISIDEWMGGGGKRGANTRTNVPLQNEVDFGTRVSA